MVEVHQVLSHSTPKAYADLIKFYEERFGKVLDKELKSLPYEVQIGIFWRYLDENGMDWDLSNLGIDNLKDSLIEIFENYEQVIKHYS